MMRSACRTLSGANLCRIRPQALAYLERTIAGNRRFDLASPRPFSRVVQRLTDLAPLPFRGAVFASPAPSPCLASIQATTDSR